MEENRCIVNAAIAFCMNVVLLSGGKKKKKKIAEMGSINYKMLLG